MEKAKIFISSTYSDLENYRREVEATLKVLDSESISMEHFGISHKEPFEVCKDKIEQCDIFVGIYAFRYGYLPKGYKKSITHLEYEYAIKHKKPILCFLAKETIRDDKEYKREHCESDNDTIEALKWFKEKIREEKVIREFGSLQELGKYFAIELGKYYLQLNKGELDIDYLKDYPIDSDISYPKDNLPYKGLKNYSKEDARVFFGRKKLIWELLEKIDRTDSVLLFYGHSGVGKSSILHAGIASRLKSKKITFFSIKRNRSEGVDGQLNSLISNELNQKTGHKLVVVDQIEECISDPNEDKLELNNFFQSLKQYLDKNKDTKFILSFRQEFLGDIQNNTSFKDVFQYDSFNVGIMNNLEVLQAIKGIRNDKETREKYNLIIEDDFAHELSYDLLLDKKSNLAPLLQVTLSKMWEESRIASKSKFDVELYRKVKSDSLEDFVKKQIEVIGEDFPEFYQKGTLIDLLFFLTTDIGTSKVVLEEDLKKRYESIDPDRLNKLLKALGKKYLINRVEKFFFRLSHDSLGPIIRSLYLKSDFPVPRTIRILESKDYHTKQIPLFTESEIITVNDSKEYTRKLTPEEEEAIHGTTQYYESERGKQLKLQFREKRNLRLFRVSFFIAVFFLGVISYFFYRSKQEEAKNETYRLAAQSDHKIPPYAMRMLENAGKVNLYDPSIYGRIFERFNANDSIPILCTEIKLDKDIVKVEISHDSKNVAVLTKGKEINIYTIQGDPLGALVHEDSIRIMNIHPEENVLVSASDDKSIKLWYINGNTLSSFKNSLKVDNVFFGRSVNDLFVQDSVSVKRYELPAYNLIGEYKNEGKIVNAQYSTHTNQLITISKNNLKIWDVRSGQEQGSYFDNSIDGFAYAVADPYFKYLFKSLYSYTIFDLQDGLRPFKDKEEIPFGNYMSLSYAKNFFWVTSQSGNSKLYDYDFNTIKFFSTLGVTGKINISYRAKYLGAPIYTGEINIFDTTGTRVKYIPFMYGMGTNLAFTKNEKYLLTYYGKNLRIWDFNTRLTVKIPTTIDLITEDGNFTLSQFNDTLKVYNSIGTEIYTKYDILRNDYYMYGKTKGINARFLRDNSLIFFNKSKQLYKINLENMAQNSLVSDLDEPETLILSEEEKYAVVSGWKYGVRTLEIFDLAHNQRVGVISSYLENKIENIIISDRTGEVFYSKKGGRQEETREDLPVKLASFHAKAGEKVLFKLDGGNVGRILLEDSGKPVFFWDYRDTLRTFNIKGKILSKLVKEGNDYPFHFIHSDDIIISKDKSKMLYYSSFPEMGKIWQFKKSNKVIDFQGYLSESEIDDFFDKNDFYYKGNRNYYMNKGVVTDMKGLRLYDFHKQKFKFFSGSNNKLVTDNNEILFTPDGALDWLKRNNNRLPQIESKP